MTEDKKKKKGKFSEDILETLDLIAAEKKGELRRITNDLLKVSHTTGAYLEFNTCDDSDYMAWVDSRIEAREKEEAEAEKAKAEKAKKVEEDEEREVI
jgi:hypothetical protein